MTQHHDHTEHHAPTAQEGNGLAIASLVLGILSLTGLSILTGIPAIVTGAIGMKNPINKGMSIAGIIMGAISVLIAILVVLFFLFVFFIAALTSDSSPPNGGKDYQAPPSSSFHLRT